MSQPRLKVVPCFQSDAKAFVALHHRHHKPPLGCIFCVACVDEAGTVRGVAMVGRPVARMLTDGLTAEVTRVATDGCPNACSFLLGACRRIAFELGYRKIITYTLPAEGGASLRGAGWQHDGQAGGGSWSREGRQREDDHPLDIKTRWISTSSKAHQGSVVWPEPDEDLSQIGLFG